MRLPVKDVFFIHSKSAPSEYAVVDRTAQLLVGAGFSAWGYEDWEWEHETEELTYARSGKHLDMRRLVRGDPKPFKKYLQDEEVDTDVLESIFKNTKVIVVVNPTGRPTEGVLDEMQALRWMGTARRTVGRRFVLCQISTTEPDPLVTFIDYAGTLQLALPDEPDDQSLVDLAVLIVTHLLDGAVDHLSSEVGVVGWDLRTDISRSRRLAQRLQEVGFETCASFAALQHAISKADIALGSTPMRLPGVGLRLVYLSRTTRHMTNLARPSPPGIRANYQTLSKAGGQPGAAGPDPKPTPDEVYAALYTDGAQAAAEAERLIERQAAGRPRPRSYDNTLRAAEGIAASRAARLRAGSLPGDPAAGDSDEQLYERLFGKPG